MRKYTYNPNAGYSVNKSNEHFEPDFYQVIERELTDGLHSFRADITFVGSDKEGRLLASAQYLYDALTEARKLLSVEEDKAIGIGNLLNRIDNG